jgi:hypothetical protein
MRRCSADRCSSFGERTSDTERGCAGRTPEREYKTRNDKSSEMGVEMEREMRDQSQQVWKKCDAVAVRAWTEEKQE